MFRVVGNSGQKDRDYMTIPADEIRDLNSVLTMVDGRIVYEAL